MKVKFTTKYTYSPDSEDCDEYWCKLTVELPTAEGSRWLSPEVKDVDTCFFGEDLDDTWGYNCESGVSRARWKTYTSGSLSSLKLKVDNEIESLRTQLASIVNAKRQLPEPETLVFDF